MVCKLFPNEAVKKTSNTHSMHRLAQAHLCTHVACDEVFRVILSSLNTSNSPNLPALRAPWFFQVSWSGERPAPRALVPELLRSSGHHCPHSRIPWRSRLSGGGGDLPEVQGRKPSLSGAYLVPMTITQQQSLEILT